MRILLPVRSSEPRMPAGPGQWGATAGDCAAARDDRVRRKGERNTGGTGMSEAIRVAIVTGAAGGIGRALVRGLLGAGLRVAAVDRTAEGLATLAADAAAMSRDAALLTIEADLSGDAAAADIVARTRGRFGKIDILVNNAGVGQATLRA